MHPLPCTLSPINTHPVASKQVMGFLVHSRGEHTTLSSWEDLFDVIVVGAAKPGFLSNDYMSLFQVEKSGTLRNIEDKDSLCLQTITGGNKIFQGG